MPSLGPMDAVLVIMHLPLRHRPVDMLIIMRITHLLLLRPPVPMSMWSQPRTIMSMTAALA